MLEKEIKRVIVRERDYGAIFLIIFLIGALLVNAFGWGGAFGLFVLGMILGTAINLFTRWWLNK